MNPTAKALELMNLNRELVEENNRLLGEANSRWHFQENEAKMRDVLRGTANAIDMIVQLIDAGRDMATVRVQLVSLLPELRKWEVR